MCGVDVIFVLFSFWHVLKFRLWFRVLLCSLDCSCGELSGCWRVLLLWLWIISVKLLGCVGMLLCHI